MSFHVCLHEISLHNRQCKAPNVMVRSKTFGSQSPSSYQRTRLLSLQDHRGRSQRSRNPKVLTRFAESSHVFDAPLSLFSVLFKVSAQFHQAPLTSASSHLPSAAGQKVSRCHWIIFRQEPEMSNRAPLCKDAEMRCRLIHTQDLGCLTSHSAEEQ